MAQITQPDRTTLPKLAVGWAGAPTGAYSVDEMQQPWQWWIDRDDLTLIITRADVLVEK